MLRPESWLLTLWCEVARHIDMAESADALLVALSNALPVEGLTIYHLDRNAETPERIAHAGVHSRWKPPVGAALSRYLAQPRARLLTLDDAWPRGCALGALHSRQGARGIAVFTLSATLQPSHATLLEQALEPLGTALDNQLRLTELARLRNTAEADRNSLLSRLGRPSISNEIIGVDGGLAEVMARAELVARSDSTVLILGETGSGKEVIARFIHEHSRRSGGPFLRVNCGAIPSDLIDSQLFGHEKGSFTGAAVAHRGWFERADGGTLFLDEIGELPPPAQVRLLRVLQEGSFHRLGGEQEVQVDVRIVAATHRNLANGVRTGQFREDLWYRINIFPLNLPPLRERRQDIPALAAHLAQRAAQRLGLPAVQPSYSDLQQLRDYDWPGNVREMSAVIERAAILGGGRHLAIAQALGADSAAGSSQPSSLAGHAAGGRPVGTLEAVIRDHLVHTLLSTEGRIEGRHGAAQLLDINPSTLRSRLRGLGLNPASFRRELGA